MIFGEYTKTIKIGYFIVLGLTSILLYGIEQGFSQSQTNVNVNATQFTTYENKELGISFRYPSNWIKIDENFTKRIPELSKRAFGDQNLTADEKIIAEAFPIAFFILPDKNQITGVALVNHSFPNSISMDKFNEVTFKMVKAITPNASLIENKNITISNNEVNKGVIEVGEGPLKGLYTSISFPKGNSIIELQLGPSNNQTQSSIINKIIESIKFNS